MSQHIFTRSVNGMDCQIQIGWDKPMSRFYFVVSPFLGHDPDQGDDDLDDPIYSNLYLENPSLLTIEEIKVFFDELDVELPVGLLINIATDKTLNRVGVRHDYE